VSVAGSDNLMWHVNAIRERQRDVDRAEGEVKAKVAALVAAAASTSLDTAAAPAMPLTFGPSHAQLAQRFYRDTEPLPPEEPTANDAQQQQGEGEREGRPRKRRSRWETADEPATTAPGSALALVGGIPDEAAIKAHLAGIVAKNMAAHGGGGAGGDGGIGAADGGPTPASSDDPEVVRQYARWGLYRSNPVDP
jgi:splicing factor 1